MAFGHLCIDKKYGEHTFSRKYEDGKIVFDYYDSIINFGGLYAI